MGKINARQIDGFNELKEDLNKVKESVRESTEGPAGDINVLYKRTRELNENKLSVEGGTISGDLEVTGTIKGNFDGKVEALAEYVTAKIAGEIAKMVGSAPEALDTLYELAKALDDDPNFSTTVMTAISKKLDATDTAVNAEKVNGLTVETAVPKDAVFTDTTYTDFVGSGPDAKAGLVPAPDATAGENKYLCEDGTWKTILIPEGGDTKMEQNVSDADGEHPVLLCPTAGAEEDQGATTGIFAPGVKVNPSTSNIIAALFTGDLNGNASSASKLNGQTVLTVKSFNASTGELELTSLS